MNLNQNLTAPLSGDPTGSLQLDIGAFDLTAMKYTDKEEWRAIPGYEGYYDISSQGNGISLKRNIIKKSGAIYPVRGTLLKLLIDNFDNRNSEKLCNPEFINSKMSLTVANNGVYSN